MADNITIKNSDGLRNGLMSRNLYSLDNEYPMVSDKNLDNIVKGISNIASTLLPFKSNSIADSLVGRSVMDKSKITELGLVYLAKNISYTVKDNLLADYTPKINVATLFNKNDDEKFISWTDNTITKKSANTFFGSIGNFVKEAAGIQNDVSHDLAFDVDIDVNDTKLGKYTNFKYISEHTGKGQLDFMLNNIKRNKYVFTDIIKSPILNKRIDKKFRKYFDTHIEYGGVIDIKNDENSNDKNNQVNFINYNLENTIPITEDKFIWGLDNNEITAKSGLLAYTKNVLNKSNNKPIKDGRGFQLNKDKESYNGSDLFKSPENSLFEGQEGLRQHSFKAQYGSYARAIRFNGNKVYHGNSNSVIYNTVMPQIHPTLYKNNNKVYDKNLMFSIENLADNLTVIDDHAEDANNNWIPLSEVGLNGGRMMWFPPYDIQFSEVTSNKIDETMMVGRGEPIYTYTNSARTANLGFKLIIDCPPQLREMRRKGDLTSRDVENFFAFGVNLDNDKKNDNKKKEIIEQKITSLMSYKLTCDDNLSTPEIFISFPNNEPTVNGINNIFNEIHDNGYEDGVTKDNASGSTNFGINKDIYYDFGFENGNPISGDQYKYDSTKKNVLDDYLKNIFSDINNRDHYDICITTGTSRLWTDDSNQILSENRSLALKKLISDRFKTIFNEDIEKAGINIKIEIKSTGETLALVDSTLQDINLEQVKRERFGTIQILRNGTPSIYSNEENLDKESKILLENYRTELFDIGDRKRVTDYGLNSNFVNIEGNKTDVVDGMDKSPLTVNTYKPVFHSQTPEEFHRRLTFLQQCMRQGKSLNLKDNVSNSAFGRQPFSIIRLGDHIYSKVIFSTLTIDYDSKDMLWDTNPEGWGMQPMAANVTLQMFVVGGQSLEGPISVLQNAISYNYYANSTFKDRGYYTDGSIHRNNNETIEK